MASLPLKADYYEKIAKNKYVCLIRYDTFKIM